MKQAHRQHSNRGIGPSFSGSENTVGKKITREGIFHISFLDLSSPRRVFLQKSLRHHRHRLLQHNAPVSSGHSDLASPKYTHAARTHCTSSIEHNPCRGGGKKKVDTDTTPGITPRALAPWPQFLLSYWGGRGKRGANPTFTIQTTSSQQTLGSLSQLQRVKCIPHMPLHW